MSNIIIERLVFTGPKKNANIPLGIGVNVICGASDTGKSYFAESIDYMLGGSKLRQIPEADGYDSIAITLTINNESYILQRSMAGGDFEFSKISPQGLIETTLTLSSKHVHNETSNVSGFLLNIIGLLGKYILFSKTHYTTRSLSFRNIARLLIIQDEEIQTKGSPFWDGQFTQKTLELATTKLLLSGIDDSSIISSTISETVSIDQIANYDFIINEMIEELKSTSNESDLKDQLDKLNNTIEQEKELLDNVETEYNELLTNRSEKMLYKQSINNRKAEISEHLVRFNLLMDSYQVDIERLLAIKESGSMFLHLNESPCPLCGALPESKHIDSECEGNSFKIISAADSEIVKIEKLKVELSNTISDLLKENAKCVDAIKSTDAEIGILNKRFNINFSLDLKNRRNVYSDLLNKKHEIINDLAKYVLLNNIIEKKEKLIRKDDDKTVSTKSSIDIGIPDSVMDSFSKKLELIFMEWNFPGEGRVYYDKEKCDFVIDGKHRGSRGRGLRAITHAAITIGLMEYCMENDLPHPGLVVLDSPLLAYYKPEGDDDLVLQGSSLKENFYEYLLVHHKDSQVIIIENQHPPMEYQEKVNTIIFTGNPKIGRYGLL